MIFLDSDISIDILRGDIDLPQLVEKYSKSQLAIASPTYFEIYNGIYYFKYTKKNKSKEFIKKMEQSVDMLVNNTHMFPLTMFSAKKGSEIYNKLIGEGKEIDPFDCLIAGVIFENEYNSILTNNISHFNRIEGLKIFKLEN